MTLHHVGRSWSPGSGWVSSRVQLPQSILAVFAFTLGAAGVLDAAWRRSDKPRRRLRIVRLCVYSLHIAAAMYVLHLTVWVLAYCNWAWAMFHPGTGGTFRFWGARTQASILRGDYEWVYALIGLVWLGVYWRCALRAELGRRNIETLWLIVMLLGLYFAIVTSPLFWSRLIL